ncbi:MAG: hypothetical protein RML56_11140, partial [Burkholderiales bacterium]|nr:hypothetical protein [Burkholderiales bacterium]
TARLRHNTPVTLSINLSDTNGATEGSGADDPSLTFANAAFRVTDSAGNAVATFGTHIAGKPSNVGFGAQADRFLQAIRTDTNTGSCVGVFQGKTVTVQMAGARINPTGGSSQVEILNSGGSFVAVATSAGAPPGTYTNVTLAFDAQSKAPLVFRYPDAGLIQIFARYELPSPPSGVYMSGSSNQFVVRPFGLRISGVTTSASPSPSDPAPYIAGQNFNVTLTAVQWKTGDDTDTNGVPDSEAQIAGNAADAELRAGGLRRQQSRSRIRSTPLREAPSVHSAEQPPSAVSRAARRRRRSTGARWASSTCLRLRTITSAAGRTSRTPLPD